MRRKVEQVTTVQGIMMRRWEVYDKMTGLLKYHSMSPVSSMGRIIRLKHIDVKVIQL